MTKDEKLDLVLPARLLELGEALHVNGSFRRPHPRQPGAQQPNAEQVGSLVDALLDKATNDVAARRLLGLRRGTARDAARIRLKAAAVLGWQHLRASVGAIDIGDLAASCADPKLPPSDGLLRARHEIGTMIAEDTLIGEADHAGTYDKARLSPRGLEILAGGRASMGALTAHKLAGILVPKGLDEYERPPADLPVPTARELRTKIGEKVIGLDGQVAALSGLLRLHLARARLIRAGKDGGANLAILLVGASGSGKTWLLETAGAVIQCPFASVSATAMTSEAFQGGKVDDLFKALALKAKGDVQAARYGIAFTDEWDAKAMRHSATGNREVTTLCVQQEYLVPMQGAEFLISGKRSMERPIMFDSRGTFFAFAGAFAGLDEVIRKRNGRGFIGFAAPSRTRTRRQQYLLDAVAEYGYLKTWTNRLSSVLFLPIPSAGSLGRAAAGATLESVNTVLAELGVVLFPQPGVVVERIVEYALDTRTFYRGVRSAWWALAEAAVSADSKGTVVVTKGDLDAAIGRLATGSAAGAGDRLSPGADAFEGQDGGESDSNGAGG